MAAKDHIKSIKEALKKSKLDAYIIPSSDPHQSEYVADHWKSRQWVSNFSGSAGLVVITQTHAGLWTDSRYFLQAEQELKGTGMTLHKQNVQGAPEHMDWLRDQLAPGSTVAFDGKCFSISQVESMAKTFGEKGIKIDADVDLISAIWKNRPPLPNGQFFELSEYYTGMSRIERISRIQKAIISQNIQHYLITTLDDLCWVLNIRSNDVEYNPVCIAYAVISQNKTTFFVDSSKVPDSIKKSFAKEKIDIQPYEAIEGFLKKINKTDKIWVDKSTASEWLGSIIKKDQLYSGHNIPKNLKAIKNETEIRHIKHAMMKDGISLTKAFMWLESEVKKREVSEVEIAEKIIESRQIHDDYIGESFGAIIGYGSNGAIIHYHPEKGKCAMVKQKGILLIDCGGQYKCGTTDITRTLALGKPTKEQKLHFTMVLKGNIALSMAKFPTGTRGVQLDILARQFLWQHGLGYLHGTGHGVGFFLNVHEPPQGFTSGLGERAVTIIEKGMLTSNEPGMYVEGSHGIRIENLILAVEDEITDYGEFLSFDTLTLFPIEQKLINTKYLSNHEIKWLNDYHSKVYDLIHPFLTKKEAKWLKEKTKPIK